MDTRTLITEISKKLGPPKRRAAFGTWTPMAWVVRGLVEQGHGTTDAVNHVLDSSGLANNDKAFGSLRASYYKIRDKEWPAELSEKETEEGFE